MSMSTPLPSTSLPSQPFAANYGLFGRPTTINNTETYASVPAIIRNGPEWFQGLSLTKNGGPKIFSVSGCVQQGGNFEVPLGTTFDELLEMALRPEFIYDHKWRMGDMLIWDNRSAFHKAGHKKGESYAEHEHRTMWRITIRGARPY